jgi:hypothetical protein
VIVQLVPLPQAPSPFASDTSGQYDHFQSRRLKEEGMLTVVKRQQAVVREASPSMAVGVGFSLVVYNFLFSLIGDDANMHHETTPFQSRSISLPVIVHLHPRHTSILHLSQNI